MNHSLTMWTLMVIINYGVVVKILFCP